MTDRIAFLRERALRSRNTGDPQAEALHREAWQATEGEPTVLRAAKVTAHYYRHMVVAIHEGELLVGSNPGLVFEPGDEITPAVFGRRDWQPPPDSYWPVPEETKVFWTEGLLSPAGNHTTLDYETVFAIGFQGLIARIEARLARLLPDDDGLHRKREFLQALKIVAEGYLDLSHRYADEAERLAGLEADPARRAELEAIAGNCRRVPAEPPRTFWEACQCAWFAFFFLPDAPGRVDQYLFPCYRSDIRQGALEQDFARELLSCLWVKYFESVGAPSGVSAHNHLTLGGVKPDGSDASNEVTELCLDVVEDIRLLRPQVGVRWNRNTPPELLRRAVRALRSGTGSPDFCSDEQIVPALARIGVSLEDARDFSLSGCHEVIVTGKAQMGSVEGFVNMPKILRMALGLEAALQAPPDLAALDSFEALQARLEESMDLVAEAAHLSSVGRDRAAAEQPGGYLQASLVVNDCIERCLGYTQGGARYNFCNWDVIGVANLADSLAVIRRLVYDERRMSLAEFTQLLASDWASEELLRRQVGSEYAHFGNEVGEVDELAVWSIATFDRLLKQHTPYRGGCYILGTTAGGENMHIEFGRITGATADGRRAGEPVADSVGAAQGRDRSGVTALLNSVAGLPHELLPTATTLNVKLDPQLLRSEAGIDAIAGLIQGHFAAGGQQLQFTFANRQMLLEAKARPDLYRNLMVRVAGYSAPFTSLWEDMQDEIIARTEHVAG
jgi:formate C-acetyltransferase